MLQQILIDELVTKLVETESNDLHLKGGRRRPSGCVVCFSTWKVTRSFVRLTPRTWSGNHVRESRQGVRGGREGGFLLRGVGVGRFRVNAFRQRGSVSVVMRFIPFGVPKFEDLNLQEVIERLAREERGIILDTGTTGSGKSTTLAGMLDQVNRTSSKHIVTIEAIELLHRGEKCIINQREVGTDPTSFSRALRRVLRQEPDITLIGDVRDSETAQIALSVAESGHLVLSTLHTLDATETVNRMIELFPPHKQSQVRAMLAGSSRALSGSVYCGPKTARGGSPPARS